MDDIQHTKDLLKEKQDFFIKKRGWNRFWTQVFVLSAASLSGTATVCIGIAETFDNKMWSVAALVASGLATVIGIWQGVLKHSRLWHINNITRLELDALDRRIQRLEAKGTIDEETAEGLGDKLEEIILKADKLWVKTYSPEDS